MPNKNRPRLLVARRVPAAVGTRAQSELNAYVTHADMDAASVVEFCNRYQTPALLIGKRSGLQAEHIEALPSCVKIIANASAGTDHMDVAAAHARGIVVSNAPDALTDCTADFTLLL